jgi:hypothetical protein
MDIAKKTALLPENGKDSPSIGKKNGTILRTFLKTTLNPNSLSFAWLKPPVTGRV